MTSEAFKEMYLAGYAEFDRGNYHVAASLASQCLAAAPAVSYWHFGALGLRCWAANGMGDDRSVERDAQALLSADAGADKPWFDGLALLNLGLARQRNGRIAEAEAFFAQASARYAAYRVGPEQPPGWAWVSSFFVALTSWAASGDSRALKDLAQDLAGLPDADAETRQLARAADLCLRHAAGDAVRAEAEAAAAAGVSRAFLALVLLAGRDDHSQRSDRFQL